MHQMSARFLHVFCVFFLLSQFVAAASKRKSETGNTFHHEIDDMHRDTHRVDLLDNGTTYIHHRYTFVHPDTQRFVTKYVAGILATHRYVFLELNESTIDHVGVLASEASAKDDGDALTIELAASSPEIRRALDDYAGLTRGGKTLVIVSSEWTDRRARHMMHHVESVVKTASCAHPPSPTILCTHSLVLKAAQYAELFEHLNVTFVTSHLPHTHSASPKGGPASKVSEFQAVPQKRRASTESVFDWIADTISSSVEAAVSAAASTAQAALSVAETAAGTLVALASGSINWQQSNIVLGSFVYNRADSSSIQKVSTEWTYTGDVKLAVSAKLTTQLTFSLIIDNFNLVSLSVDISGDLYAEVWAQTTSTFTSNIADRQLLSTITMSPIAFSIGPVHVVINPSIPIYYGYEFNFVATVVLTAIASGVGKSPSASRTIQPALVAATHVLPHRNANERIGRSLLHKLH